VLDELPLRPWAFGARISRVSPQFVAGVDLCSDAPLGVFCKKERRLSDIFSENHGEDIQLQIRHLLFTSEWKHKKYFLLFKWSLTIRKVVFSKGTIILSS